MSSRSVLEGRNAQARGDLAAARNVFDEAVDVQDRLAYAEPLHWYSPVRRSLGAVLLSRGDLDGAEAVFRASLRDAPNNGWALHGLVEVYRRQGRAQAEAENAAVSPAPGPAARRTSRACKGVC
jgi:tetratricopeptide (TPR) repeat protein